MNKEKLTDQQIRELVAELAPLAEHVATLKKDAELTESLSVVRRHYKTAFLTFVGILAAAATMGNQIVEWIKWVLRP